MASEQAVETNIPVKEQIPQVPWEVWLQNLPQKVKDKIINFDDFLQSNAIFRKSLGSQSDKTYYRPGLGLSGILQNILLPVGTWNKVIISDPAFLENKGAQEFGTGLPLSVYLQELTEVGAVNMKVVKIDDNKKTQLSGNAYHSFQILSTKEQVQIEFQLNGVDLNIILQARDMTKDYPNNYDILGLGRPGPIEKKDGDPKADLRFGPESIKRLNLNGLISYSQINFAFIPELIDFAALGFKLVTNEQKLGKKDLIIIQKERLVREEIYEFFQETAQDIVKLSHFLSGEIVDDTKRFHFWREADLDQAPDNWTEVLNLYQDTLAKVKEFTDLVDTLAAKVKFLRRLERILFRGIANGKQLKDVEDLQNFVSDPPTSFVGDLKERYEPPYCGTFHQIIAENNQKQSDFRVLFYWQSLIDLFYKTFPELDMSN